MMGLTGIELGGVMFAFMLVLLALRVHIGVAMLLTGSVMAVSGLLLATMEPDGGTPMALARVKAELHRVLRHPRGWHSCEC